MSSKSRKSAKIHIFETDFFVGVGFRGTYTYAKSSKPPGINVSLWALEVFKKSMKNSSYKKSYELCKKNVFFANPPYGGNGPLRATTIRSFLKIILFNGKSPKLSKISIFKSRCRRRRFHWGGVLARTTSPTRGSVRDQVAGLFTSPGLALALGSLPCSMRRQLLM